MMRRSVITVSGLMLLIGLPGWATAEDGAKSLPPIPVTTPLPPTTQPSAAEEDDELLLKHLDRLIADRDQRISQLPSTGPAGAAVHRTPRIDTHDPAAQEALTQHAAARAELRKALEDAAAQAGQGQADVLDRGRPRGQAAQLGPLSAANQLAVAECYKDLAGGSGGTAADTDSGLKALMAIDASRLNDAERPRHLYLTLWFQLDGVRKLAKDAPAAERAKRLQAARDTRTDLANQYPASALSQTADALFAGLDDHP